MTSVYFKSLYYCERHHKDAHIKVDIDNHKNKLRIGDVRTTAAWLTSNRFETCKVMVFETRRGYHIRLWFTRAPGPYTTVRIQEMLGDDPVRTHFNRRRVRRKEQHWNILWNEKWRNGKRISHEVFDERLTKKLERILFS